MSAQTLQVTIPAERIGIDEDGNAVIWLRLDSNLSVHAIAAGVSVETVDATPSGYSDIEITANPITSECDNCTDTATQLGYFDGIEWNVCDDCAENVDTRELEPTKETP